MLVSSSTTEGKKAENDINQEIYQRPAEQMKTVLEDCL